MRQPVLLCTGCQGLVLKGLKDIYVKLATYIHLLSRPRTVEIYLISCMSTRNVSHLLSLGIISYQQFVIIIIVLLLVC
jgi:hypothetical protein